MRNVVVIPIWLVRVSMIVNIHGMDKRILNSKTVIKSREMVVKSIKTGNKLIQNPFSIERRVVSKSVALLCNLIDVV